MQFSVQLCSLWFSLQNIAETHLDNLSFMFHCRVAVEKTLNIKIYFHQNRKLYYELINILLAMLSNSLIHVSWGHQLHHHYFKVSLSLFLFCTFYFQTFNGRMRRGRVGKVWKLGYFLWRNFVLFPPYLNLTSNIRNLSASATLDTMRSPADS